MKAWHEPNSVHTNRRPSKCGKTCVTAARAPPPHIIPARRTGVCKDVVPLASQADLTQTAV
jgi:hypothetical protein